MRYDEQGRLVRVYACKTGEKPWHGVKRGQHRERRDSAGTTSA
jgi:hypothetical protein